MAEVVDERFQCPICREVFRSPVGIGACGHMFCKECVSQLPVSDGRMDCPVCRVSFLYRDLRAETSLEFSMTRYTVTCKTCREKCKLSDWRDHESRHPVLPHPLPSHINRRSAAVPNRSTFNCPLCPQQHLTTSDLRSHVSENHSRSREPVVCPICASMPWGVKDQVSQNFVQHLQHRHKFEYDTYVDYGQDEEAVLLATIKASLTEQ